MAVFDNWPYTDFHQLNLDWIIRFVKEYLAKVDKLEIDFKDLHDYVNNYFDSVDFAQLVNDKIDELVADGVFTSLFAEYTTRVYDTVLEMKADTLLTPGAHAHTNGYYALNDGGEGDYIITDVTPSRWYEVLTNGLNAELIPGSTINVLQFGAKGDNATDDTNAIQQAFNNAYANNCTVEFADRTFVIENSITVPSGLHIEGKGATIKAAFNGPAFTSGLVSYVTIRNITIIGSNDDTMTDNAAISFVPYYCDFEKLDIFNFYTGILFRTDGADSTLVENKIRNCTFRSCNTSLNLGIDGNNKLTDGIIQNCYIQSKSASYPAIIIGSSAGWNIDTVHIYGNCSDAIQIPNAFYTTLNNLYIESGSTLVRASKLQTALNISNMSGKLAANAKGIIVAKGGYTPLGTPTVNLTNINFGVMGENATGIYDGGGNTPMIKLVNFSYLADNITTFTSVNLASKGNLTYTGNLSGSNSSDALYYNGNRVSQHNTSMFNGSAEKTVTISVPHNMSSYDFVYAKVRIIGRINYNGTSEIDYSSDLMIVNKGGTINLFKYNESGAGSGFQSAPTYSFDLSTRQLTIKFTQSQATGYGRCWVEMF